MAELLPELIVEIEPPVALKGGGKLERLKLSEPIAQHVMIAERHLAKLGAVSRRRYQAQLIALTAKVPEDALSALPISTFMRAASYLQAFVMANLPKQGEDDAVLADEPEDAAADTLTVVFDEPIEHSGIPYVELTVREPTLDQMSKAEGALSDVSDAKVRLYQILLVHHTTDLPLPVVHRLPISLLNQAAVFAQRFSLAGRAITAS